MSTRHRRIWQTIPAFRDQPHGDTRLKFGIELRIEKGIPLGSGLGGPAASAVAAAVASGAFHADNVAASLFGGMVLSIGTDNPRIQRIPVPSAILCVLVHPRIFLATREARAILKPVVALSDVVAQTANLAGFLSGCHTNDLDLLRRSFEDIIIEPQRAHLIPGLEQVKRAATRHGLECDRWISPIATEGARVLERQ
jgi:homoserine kinase